jgi:protein-disulfide isomerase
MQIEREARTVLLWLTITPDQLANTAPASVSSAVLASLARVQPHPQDEPDSASSIDWRLTLMGRTITRLIAALFAIGLSHTAVAADAPADPRMAEHALGNPKAPVRLDEYYSLDCPHCAAFVKETLPDLQKNYIDTGKVYLVLHDFPLHDPAVWATMVARCVPPDRFFPMVETLFAVQQGWYLPTPEATKDALKQQAKFAGLTDQQVDACLNDTGLEDAILNERLEAEQKLKIAATPTFIFNGKSDDRIEAAGPYSAFKEKIDGLLKK